MCGSNGELKRVGVVNRGLARWLVWVPYLNARFKLQCHLAIDMLPSYK